MRSINQVATVILIIVTLASACTKDDQSKKETTGTSFCLNDSMKKMIVTGIVQKENITDELMLSGEVAFNEDKVVKVFPLVSGHIDDVKVSLGDHVEQGQVLAVIRSSDVAENDNEFIGAKSDLEIARKNLDAQKDLYQNGVASEKDYIEAQQNYEKAKAVFARVNEVRKLYGGGGGSVYLARSPQSGFIVEKKVNDGMEIRTDNADNMFTISNLKDVWVIANVFEADISRVHLGDSVKITTIAYPDNMLYGKVDKITDVLDPESKVMKIRIRLPNSDSKLKPEMFANITVFNKESQSAVKIPSSALLFANSKNYVIVYHSDCDLEIREVKIIKSLEDKTYLLNGPAEGDTVVCKNQVLIYNAIIEKQ